MIIFLFMQSTFQFLPNLPASIYINNIHYKFYMDSNMLLKPILYMQFSFRSNKNGYHITQPTYLLLIKSAFHKWYTSLHVDRNTEKILTHISVKHTILTHNISCEQLPPIICKICDTCLI